MDTYFFKFPPAWELMRDMTRREFFAESFGLLLGAALLRTFRVPNIFSARSGSTSELVVARNGTPQELLTAALNAHGGLEKVVKKGQRVVIKVNISFYATPGEAVTTNPELVEALVRACWEAGAREVLVIDHTIDNGEMCMNSSGVREAVERARGKMKVINSQRDYKEVEIPRGKSLKKTLLSRDVLNADVFINVPIAKVHNSAVTTVSMKNLMGIVWDRGELHWLDLHQCIADLSTVVRPDLIILDAYQILMTNGPGGPGEVRNAGEVVVGTDPVAVDAYGTMLLEIDPEDVDYLRAAYDLGLGEMDMGKVTTRYVDAQVETKPPETTKPAETKPPETKSAETTKPEETEPSETEPPAEEEETEEEKEAGIPTIILIPAIIVSFLIGLRMRRKNKDEKEDIRE